MLVLFLSVGATRVPAGSVGGISGDPRIVSGAAGAASDWERLDPTGFAAPSAVEVTALEVFNGYLYAGNHNPIDPGQFYDGAQISRSPDGVSWTAVTQPGFGNTHDTAPPAILDFVVFNNRLYAGTGRGNACQVWRSPNGTIWAPMTVTGFSDPDNVEVTCFAVFNDLIYAGVRNDATGAQIWRSFSGDNNSWSKVAPAQPGASAASVTGFAEFDGALYAAVESEAPAQIWRSQGGAAGSWETVVDDGFGDPDTLWTGGLCVFAGWLHVGAGNATGGALLYRTRDGATWEPVPAPGLGDPHNRQVDMVCVVQNELHVTLRNTVTGIEIWRSADGTLWEQVNQDGFGDPGNAGTNRSNATAEFLKRLCVGTANAVGGGELWRQLKTNNAPTDITLSSDTVDENQPVDTVVGNLGATDPDAGDTFTFTLASAVPGLDNDSFSVRGTELRTAGAFDFETKPEYRLCIRVTDPGGLTFDKSFLVRVNDLFELRIVQVTGDASHAAVTINTKPGEGYTIEYTDEHLGDTTLWQGFANPALGVGYWLEAGPSVATHTFVDDFSSLSSGAPPARGYRAYRVRTGAPMR